MERILSNILLGGVVASTVVILLGLTLLVATNSTGYVCDSASSDSLSCILGYNSGHSASQLYPITLVAITSGLIALKPLAVIQLGVITLLATPVLRVASSLVLFAIEKNRAFVLITFFVLLILFFSFFVVPLIPIFKA